MTVAEDGRIFISYRRQETSHLAGRLYDRLADRFGENQVFIDVDAIGLGVDFGEEIRRAVAACKVLLAVIGPDWLTVTDVRGNRRLGDPDNIVRLEIEAALARDVRVIPILVEGASMPCWDDLPESLALARRNAPSIRHKGFRSDVGHLVAAIERTLAATPGATDFNTPDTGGAPPARNAVGEVAQQGARSSRSDPTRAARLLTDAELIAYSITSEYRKIEALSDIAEVLAATDPDYAARLLTDIEHLADSATDGTSRASCLVASRKCWPLSTLIMPPSSSLTPNASPNPSPRGIRRHRHSATSQGRWPPSIPTALKTSPPPSPTTTAGHWPDRRREGAGLHGPRPRRAAC